MWKKEKPISLNRQATNINGTVLKFKIYKVY